MNPGGDEHEVEALAVGAQHVGRQAVADRQNPPPVARLAGQPLDGGVAQVVDRRIGLARHDDRPAKAGVQVGQRSGAQDDLVAALHHLVGIGADHHQPPFGGAGQGMAVLVQRVVLVVEQAGAGDEGRLVGPRGQADVDAVIDDVVALRPQLPRRAFGGELA